MNFSELKAKQTIFVGVDPAAVNIIWAIIFDLLTTNNWRQDDVTVFTNKKGIIHSGLKKSTRVIEFNVDSIQNVLSEYQPQQVFLGTSVGNQEWQWISECKKRGVETISIIDYWSNYRNRYLRDEQLYLPSKILVIDEKAKEEAIAEGLPEQLISVVRNPHFALVENYKPPMNKSSFKDVNLLNEGEIIVFVSDDIKANNLAVGFDEYSVLESLLKAFQQLQLKKKYHFVIKLHPRDEEKKFDELIAKYVSDNLVVNVIKAIDSKLLCYFADYVIGMFSTMVIEALLLKKPVLRVEINQKKELFNFSEIDCPLVTNEEKLSSALKEFIN